MIEDEKKIGKNKFSDNKWLENEEFLNRVISWSTNIHSQSLQLHDLGTAIPENKVTIKIINIFKKIQNVLVITMINCKKYTMYAHTNTEIRRMKEIQKDSLAYLKKQYDCLTFQRRLKCLQNILN